MLYGLEEVERVDSLAHELEANDRAWDLHYADRRPSELQRRRDRIFDRMRTPARPDLEKPLTDRLIAFPGMVGYRAPSPSSKAVNVRKPLNLRRRRT